MPSLEIPNPLTLPGAVLEVIRQNEAAGYTSARFRIVTENGQADDLVAKCQSLINDEGTLGHLVLAVDTYDTFLALEDLVALSRNSGQWGLDEPTVTEAKRRSEALNLLREQLGKAEWTPTN